jgi:hypothetical protein
MSKGFLFSVIPAAIVLSGCANNPNIPTYSGEVRDAVTEKAAEAGAFVRSKLSSPMPAWDSAPKKTADPTSGSAAKPDQGNLMRNEMVTPTPSTTSAVTAPDVEVYAVDSSEAGQQRRAVEVTTSGKSSK